MQVPKVVQKRYDPELIQSSYKTTFTKPPPNSTSVNADQSLVNQYYQNKPKNVPFYSDTEYKKTSSKNDHWRNDKKLFIL